MNEKIEYKGYWWLPSDPEKTVAGVLIYTPHEEIMLELIGNIDAGMFFFDDLSDQKHENIIHGFTSDAKDITLVNCFRSGSQNFSCTFPIINYKCQFLIIGKRIDDFKQKCFYKAFIRIPILSYWCPPSVIKTVSTLDKDNIDSVSISCGSPKIIDTFNIDDNTQVLLKEGFDYHSNHLSPQLNQGMYLEILKENDTSISDFYSNIYLYEQFLSLAALRTVKCYEISLYDKTVYQEFKDGEKHYFPIQLIYVQRKFNYSHKFQRSDFLFTYKSIKTQYPEIIRRWYS